MAVRLSGITYNLIANTRGDPALEVTIKTNTGLEATASVPEGKSLSPHEPVSKLQAADLELAIDKLIKPTLTSWPLDSGTAFDQALIELDGTTNYERLGAPLVLALSMAARRLQAQIQRQPLWQLLRQEYGLAGSELITPVFLVNCISGGLHANTAVCFQEYLTVINQGTAADRFTDSLIIYRKLKDRYPQVPLSDEAGLSFTFDDSTKPLRLLRQAIEETGLIKRVGLGLDAAANTFAEGDHYVYDRQNLSGAELLTRYRQMIAEFGLDYLEDPFSNVDQGLAAQLISGYGGQLVVAGDDSIASRANLLIEGLQQNAINAVILKPNQVGTISGLLETTRLAKEKKCRFVVSHRSGETEDTFICHLAYAVQAWGVKLGAPIKDGVTKYNEMLRIEKAGPTRNI